MNAGSTLNAIGTAGNRITFTSSKDDGVQTPARGDYSGLLISGVGTLAYADVKYGGWGCCADYSGANVTANANAYVTIDHCGIYFSKTSGVGAASGVASLQVSHTEISYNAAGVSVFNSPFDVSYSRIALNDHSGFYVNLTNYAGPAGSVLNSDIKDNGWYGLNLIVSGSTLPTGHYNNIFNNGINDGGPAQRQLAALYIIKNSNWSDNYWGPTIYGPSEACSWAPNTTTQRHIAYFAFPINWQLPDACTPPAAGPVSSDTYTLYDSSCVTTNTKYCAADRVIAWPVTTSPYTNWP